jgi:hypothetical protein
LESNALIVRRTNQGSLKAYSGLGRSLTLQPL